MTQAMKEKKDTEQCKYSNNEILADRAKNGDEDAFEELMFTNMAMLINCVTAQNRDNRDFDDLLQVAKSALYRAVNNFEVERGLKFTTYAVPTIKQIVTNYIRDNMVNMRVSRYTIKAERYIRYRGLTEENIEDIVKATGVPLRNVKEAFQYRDSGSGFVSYLDKSLDTKEGEQNITLKDSLEGDSNKGWEEKIYVRDAIARLPERERRVIEMRFYRDMLQSDIAKELGISQVHVGRIEKKALSMLKKSLEKEGF